MIRFQHIRKTLKNLEKVSKKGLQLFLCFLVIISYLTPVPVIPLKNALEEKEDKKVRALNQYAVTGGLLETGTEVASSVDNMASWRGALGDDNNDWRVSRNNPGGLSQILYFDNVEISGANKLLIYMGANNITTNNAFQHQICDWTNSTSVQHVADANCTGGGWRNLSPRNGNETNTSESFFQYELYDGYFVDRTTSPGTPISTPINYFIRSSDKRVMIRTYSNVASTVQYRVDFAQVETAIDSVYEPADFVKTAGGATTAFISDLTGEAGEGSVGYGSDGNRFDIAQPGTSQAVDSYFIYKNVKSYTGMNTLLVTSEICVTNTALTFGIYARNFTNNTWTQIGTTITGSLCTTDTTYKSAFNSTTISGFDIADHISGTDEIWVRYLTNSPAAVYTIRFDAMYIMLGSVNTDSSLCEISWGTGTATNCTNTRDLINDDAALVTTANTSTWQNAAVIEYPAGHYPQDNDDDATNSEYAYSYNLSFPVTVASNMSITGVHHSLRFRSNISTITLTPQIKQYSGSSALGGELAGPGWRDTVGTDTNNSTSYYYIDSVLQRETLSSPEDTIDFTNNLMNLKLRTSTSTNVAGGVTADWDFAMMSIRWVEETNRTTIQTQYAPTGGLLVTGTDAALSNANVGSWRGTLGNDANYWSITRHATNGLKYYLYFDGVQLRQANKIIITLEQSNTTTATAYQHDICDWTSSTSVDYAADADCTGGGWRTLTPRKTTLSPTTDTVHQYEIYNGYFSTRTTSPGTPIATDLSNFIRSSDKRIMVRTYTVAGSTVVQKTDFAQVEVAIDPIYEIADWNKTAGGTTTGFLSDTIGAVNTGVTASDNNRLGVPNSAVSTPMDFYFIFKDVKAYTGANTFLFLSEMSVSNVDLTWGVYIRDFSGGGSWKQAGGTVTATGTGDIEYATSFNSTTTSGFSLANSISSSDEVWVRILTNGPATARTMSFDRIYSILGSVNDDSSKCEISWGTGTATNCVNTRDLVNDVVSGTPTTANTSTWQVTSAIEYPSTYYETDGDDDGTANEYAFSRNLGFPITISSGQAITGIHYATRHRSNVSTITVDPQYLSFAGAIGFGAINNGAGWQNTPSTDTNNLTTYGIYNSWLQNEMQLSPDDAIQTFTNLGYMRLRTSTSTLTTSGTVSDWDFAMMSIRYMQDFTPVISISVSDGSISYGSVAKGAAKTTVDLTDTQTVTNDSNVAVDFNIKGQNTACPWTLSGTAGTDTYEHQFCKKSDVSCSSPPTNYTDLTTSYQTLYTSVAISGTKDVDLRIVLPTTTACTASQSADITLQAVQP